MSLAIKIVVLVLCIPMLILGFGAMFNPAAVLDKFAVVPEGLYGLSTVRGELGGLLLGSVLMVVIGVVRSNTTWFLAVAVLMVTVAVGRLVGFVLDGVATAVLPSLIIELVFAAVMVFAHYKLSAVQPE